MEHRQKLSFVEKSLPPVCGRITKEVENAWQEGREMEDNEKISSVDFNNLSNRIKPRRWNTELLESLQLRRRRLLESLHFPFKTTQLLFEVVHDVEEGRTRATCLDCCEKRDTIPPEKISHDFFF